eukprot:8698799-Pyramimonas_sp.AAC.2
MEALCIASRSSRAADVIVRRDGKLQYTTSQRRCAMRRRKWFITLSPLVTLPAIPSADYSQSQSHHSQCHSFTVSPCHRVTVSQSDKSRTGHPTITEEGH